MLAQSIFPPGRIFRSGSTIQFVACITAFDTGLYGGMRTTCIQARNRSAAPKRVKTVLSRKRAISPNISGPLGNVRGAQLRRGSESDNESESVEATRLSAGRA